MHPELIDAIKERIDLGHSKEAIRAELHAAGYDDQTVEEAYREAQLSSIPAPGTSPTPSSRDSISTIVALPDAATLFSNGWSFLLKRPDLLLLLAAPFAITAVLTFMLETTQMPNKGLAAAAPGIIGLIALVSYLYIWAAAIYTVIQSSEKMISFREAFAWGKKNIGGLIWVNILAGLAAMGGFLLFFIPGVIVSIYLYLSQFVYVKEGNRGMSALLRSRELVQGNGWAVLSRLLVLGLIFFVVFLILGLLIGLVASFTYDGAAEEVIQGFFFQFLGAGATLIGVHAGMEIYRSLAAVRPATATSATDGRGKYITLAWLGLALFVLMIFSMMTAISYVPELNQESVDKQEIINIEAGLEAKERAAEMRIEDQLESSAVLE